MQPGEKKRKEASGARRCVNANLTTRDSPLTTLDDLLPWYETNKRPLPWRENPNLYSTWVSEIMLQQTGVSTVIPYFERWMARFPTVQALAEADEQGVLSLWQGLGYYRRCRNLLLGARKIAAEGWPDDAAGWRKLPGVGRYTAGAIASIALNEPAPVVDGNVERVYARLNADSASGAELKRNAWAWAGSVIRKEMPGDRNQALMELGATICTPVKPQCGECPVAAGCAARRAGIVDELPTASPKRAIVRLEFDVLVPVCNGRLGLHQIPPGEWWEGMWEFPRTPRGSGDVNGYKLPLIRHAVTHHRITLYPVVVECQKLASEFCWYAPEELDFVPLPAPQRKLAKQARAALEARHIGRTFRCS